MTQDELESKNAHLLEVGEITVTDIVNDAIAWSKKNHICLTCKHKQVDYTIESGEFTECRCPESLMYYTNIESINDGYDEFGCTLWEKK